MMNKLPGHILIALVYNRNGMASWCIEAARALICSGHRITILTTSLELLPEELHPFALCSDDLKAIGFVQKIMFRINRITQNFIPPSFYEKPVRNAYTRLQAKGEKPGLILISQSNFLCPALPVPQMVVAWAWPTGMKGYLQKSILIKGRFYIKKLQELWYWYRMDHKAYKHATGILAVSQAISESLKKTYPNTWHLYPCTNLNNASFSVAPVRKLRLFSGCLDLADPRKNVLWMVECLSLLKQKDIEFDVTLAGNCDAQTEKWIRSKLGEVTLPGTMKRDAFVAEMAQFDIFIFASLQDDWGYVLIEAMSKGLAVVVPDEHPFYEMVKNSQCRFKHGNVESFNRSIEYLLDKKTLAVEKEKQGGYATENFGYEPFVSSLGSIYNQVL